MAVKIKLKRVGKIHAPQYRIVVADSRTARNGRAIEEIGIYQPISNPSIMRVKSDRAQYWLGVGAQPTAAVEAILKVTGDWQKFKGLPGAEGTLQVAAPKPHKILAYEAAVTEAANAPKTTKPKKLEIKEEVKEVVEAAVEKVEEAVEAAVDVVESVKEKVEEKVEEPVSSDAPQEEVAKEETS
ncbi:30S ribosomal protein S16 [Alphaproteobacteria bacterium]|nr:30S ribosomal protein S16 [Alphaproteobacteria bacterium]MDB9921055.1 30S ribosomal protein S16 [Actinomycetota bacterium]